MRMMGSRKMKQAEYYENYPFWFVAVSNLLQISMYVIGAFIISHLGKFWLFIYLLYILWLELRVLMKSCVNCYYYGKRCSFGRGSLCSLLFKKGNPKTFCKNIITWKDIIPDFLVALTPIIAGIVLLIMDFRWYLLSLMVLLFLLASVGTGLVRGSLACRHCKQRKIGCPAEKLFSKKK